MTTNGIHLNLPLELSNPPGPPQPVGHSLPTALHVPIGVDHDANGCPPWRQHVCLYGAEQPADRVSVDNREFRHRQVPFTEMPDNVLVVLAFDKQYAR